MRRLGLAFWLLRVALPAIVMHWSVRAIRALRFRVDGLGHQRSEDPVTTQIKALAWGNAASLLLLLLLILAILRIIAR